VRLQPINERRDDAGDILTARAGNYSDSFDHFGCGESIFTANSTLASVARFQVAQAFYPERQ
jgi:hypothetical protein